MNTPELKIKIKHMIDESPDTSWMGKIYDSWQPGSIERSKHDLYDPSGFRGEMLYYVPDDAHLFEETRRYYQQHGYSRHEAYTQARQQVIEDYNRLIGYYNELWYFIGVVVTVELDGIEIGYDALWGIESDSGDYIKEVEQECIAEALADAKTNLAKLHSITDLDTLEPEIEHE